VETVNQLNRNITPILQKLMSHSFFRYYKLNLWRKCEFFPDDGQCALRVCAVDECSQVPPTLNVGALHYISFFITCALFKEEIENEQAWLLEADTELSKVDSSVDVQNLERWNEFDNPWTVDIADKTATYIDLAKNPERYTGYVGHTATRIWKAIYEENCFGDSDKCIEKRVFYRLISGLHASISAHLTNDYLLDAERNIWGPNLPLFRERLGRHPNRIMNLYFTYVFVLRAVTKLTPYLVTYNYSQDLHTTQEIRAVMMQLQNITFSCPHTFDETQLFQGPEEAQTQLRRQFKQHFWNISKILDCVACEKCKLWGKVQLNGLGTALKILFELSCPRRQTGSTYLSPSQNSAGALSKDDSVVNMSSEEVDDPKGLLVLNSNIHLQRTEIVALFNVLHKLGESIQIVQDMFQRQKQQTPIVTKAVSPFFLFLLKFNFWKNANLLTVFGIVSFILIALCGCKCFWSRRRGSTK
jgi:ERO1-like protein alpha